MKELKISVVLTTYNGIKYLKQLVESLRLQSQKIDEVIICDDKSTDATQEFLKSYIIEYDLTNWSLIINEKNKGWKRNFRDGIQQATGNLIFPCDQDDVWDTHKVEIMAKSFEVNPNILLLSSDYSPLYEKGGAKVDQFNETVEAINPVYIEDDEHFSVHRRPGCVMCVRKELIRKINDIWLPDYAHDAFFWTVATLLNGNFLINRKLIKYRRHSTNASTGEHRTKANQIALMEMGKSIVTWYLKNEVPISSEKKSMLSNYLQWCALRKEMLQNNKIFNFFKLIPYHAYYRSIRQELGDIYYILKL